MYFVNLKNVDQTHEKFYKKFYKSNSKRKKDNSNTSDNI